MGLLENKAKYFLAEPLFVFSGVLDHASFSLPGETETGHMQNIAGAALLSIMKGLGASLPNLWGKWYEID